MTGCMDAADRNGILYTVYYAGMLAGPAIGGKLSTSVGSASAALDLGAVVLLACPAVLWLFRRIVAGWRWPVTTTSTPYVTFTAPFATVVIIRGGPNKAAATLSPGPVPAFRPRR